MINSYQITASNIQYPISNMCAYRLNIKCYLQIAIHVTHHGMTDGWWLLVVFHGLNQSKLIMKSSATDSDYSVLDSMWTFTHCLIVRLLNCRRSTSLLQLFVSISKAFKSNKCYYFNWVEQEIHYAKQPILLFAQC